MTRVQHSQALRIPATSVGEAKEINVLQTRNGFSGSLSVRPVPRLVKRSDGCPLISTGFCALQRPTDTDAGA